MTTPTDDLLLESELLSVAEIRRSMEAATNDLHDARKLGSRDVAAASERRLREGRELLTLHALLADARVSLRDTRRELGESRTHHEQTRKERDRYAAERDEARDRVLRIAVELDDAQGAVRAARDELILARVHGVARRFADLSACEADAVRWGATVGERDCLRAEVARLGTELAAAREREPSVPRQKTAAEAALDRIAALCGCPGWSYSGQVVRDVEAMRAAAGWALFHAFETRAISEGRAARLLFGDRLLVRLLVREGRDVEAREAAARAERISAEVAAMAGGAPVPDAPRTPPAERLAMRFHEAYERLAPAHGYETRRESAKPWAEVPTQNRGLMVAVCEELLAEGAATLATLASARDDAADAFDRLIVRVWRAATGQDGHGPASVDELCERVAALRTTRGSGPFAEGAARDGCAPEEAGRG